VTVAEVRAGSPNAAAATPPTIDMRIDFLRPARGSPPAIAKIFRLGARFAVRWAAESSGCIGERQQGVGPIRVVVKIIAPCGVWNRPYDPRKSERVTVPYSTVESVES
jgi:hypothetical protein